jgi:hypothetical protein
MELAGKGRNQMYLQGSKKANFYIQLDLEWNRVWACWIASCKRPDHLHQYAGFAYALENAIRAAF